MLSFVSSPYIILLSLLVFTFLISACATLTLRQIFTLKKAVETKRSNYKKRAIQALELSFVLYSILFFASAFDIAFTQIFFISLDLAIYNVIVFLPIFLSFSLFLVRYWFRALKDSDENIVSWFWALTSSFTSLKALGLIIIGAYFSLYVSQINEFSQNRLEAIEIIEQEEISTENSEIEDILANVEISTSEDLPIMPNIDDIVERKGTSFTQFYSAVVANVYKPMFAQPLHCFYMMAFFVLAGLCLGYAFQIFYTLVCRSNDDFGRDYYNASIKDYAKSASMSLFALCLFALIGIFGNIIAFAMNANALLLLFFVLVGLLYLLISRSANPLRYKIAIALCPLFVLIGAVFFVLQTLFV